MPGKDEEVPALFSREIVLFPRMQISMTLGEEKGIGAVAQALQENRLVAFIPTDFEREREGIGVLTLVVASEQTLKGLRVELRGLWRVRVANSSGLPSNFCPTMRPGWNILPCCLRKPGGRTLRRPILNG